MRIMKCTEQSRGNFCNLNNRVSRISAKLQNTGILNAVTCFASSILNTEFELCCNLQERLFRLQRDNYNFKGGEKNIRVYKFCFLCTNLLSILRLEINVEKTKVMRISRQPSIVRIMIDQSIRTMSNISTTRVA
jgi:hypothetical protein